jgi:hypothetical protein
MRPRSLFSLFLIIFFAAVIVGAMGYNPKARLIPLVIALPCLGMAIAQFIIDLVGDGAKPLSGEEEFSRGVMERFVREEVAEKKNREEKNESVRSVGALLKSVLWTFLFVALVFLFGFLIAIPTFTLLYTRLKGESWSLSLSCAAGLWLAIYLPFVVIAKLSLYEGFVFRLLGWVTD